MDEEEIKQEEDIKQSEEPKIGSSFFVNFLQGIWYSFTGIVLSIVLIPFLFFVFMALGSGAGVSRFFESVFELLPYGIVFLPIFVFSFPHCSLPPLIFNLCLVSFIITSQEENGKKIGWLKKSFYYFLAHFLMIIYLVFSGSLSRCG